MADLTPAEKAVAEAMDKHDIRPDRIAAARAVTAAARPHIEAEVLGEVADLAHEAARQYDGRTQLGRAARDVARVVIDRWQAAGTAARRTHP